MRKLLIALLALSMIAVGFAGCRRNVSTQDDGMITDPTVTTNTVVTMPSTDTVPPITTERPDMTDPADTTFETEFSTDGTDDNGITDGNDRARAIDPRMRGRK